MVITDARQLIQRRNLDSALKEFLNPEIRGQIRAVVVEEMGSALSHAACVFRENGIPVLVASGIDVEAFKAKGTVAVLDGQQALIGTLQRDAFVGKEPSQVKTLLLEDNTLKPGWFKHPISPDESLQDYGLSDADYARLGRHLVADTSLTEFKLTDMFTKLTSSDADVAKEAARLIVTRIAVTVKNLRASQDPSVRGLAETGSRLLSNALVILDSMLATDDRMQLLHSARRLEALCYQEGSSRILEVESIRNLLVARKTVKGFKSQAVALDAADKTILTFLKQAALSKISDKDMAKALQEPMTDQEINACTLVFRSFKPLLLDEAAKVRWEELTTKLVASKSRIANQLLIDLVTQVEKAGILTEWLNFVVAESPQDMGSSLGLIVQWRDRWRSMRSFMNEIIQLQRNLNQLESAGAAWKNPRAFDALWYQMQGEVIAPLKKQIEALVADTGQSKLLTATLHRVILDGIEAFDHCIKFARSDTQEAIDTKVERFATMLESYHDLMLQLFDAIPEESFSKWSAGVCEADKRLGGSAGYRQLMRKTITDTFERLKHMRNAAQVEPSSGANVMAQCVNSGALFSSTFYPDETTLEDLFTLCHQNMLAALDCFRPTLDSRHFPDAMNRVVSSVENISETITYGDLKLTLHPSMTCQTIHYPIVTTIFNMPIKYHSGKITVEQNLVRQTTTLKFDVYGHNLNERMDLIALLLASRSWNEGIKMTSIPAYDNGTEQLSYAIECKGDIEKISTLILDAAKATLAGNFGEVPYIQGKTLIQNNPEAFRAITSTPGQVRQLLLSSPRGKYYVWDVVMEVVAQGEKVPVDASCKLLSEIGINVQAQDYQELLANLVKLLKKELTTNKNDEKITFGYTSEPVDPLKRLIRTQPLYGDNFINLFWSSISREDFSLFLSPGSGDVGGSGFYPELCSTFANYLIARKQEDLLLNFVDYLFEQGQFASLLAIQERVDRPYAEIGKVPTGFPEPEPIKRTSLYSDDEAGTDYGEEEESVWKEAVTSEEPIVAEHQANLEQEPYQRIDNRLGEHLIPGRRATERELKKDRSVPVSDPGSLQPDQWILIPGAARREGTYIKGLYTLAQVNSVTQDPSKVVVRQGGGKSEALESLEYLKLLLP